MAAVDYAILRLDRGAPETGALDPEERRRADRLSHASARRRFVAVRSALKGELGRRLGVAAGEVRLVYGEYGKPALAPPFDASGITFSVAHSGDLGLLAFGSRTAIGIDVERVREIARAEEIAHRVFTEPERAALARLEGDARRAAFFRLWTANEALVKCAGGSILAPPRDLPVRTIAEVPVPRGYAAAICVAAPALTLTERPLYSAG